VLVTHDQTVGELADRIVRLEHGRLVRGMKDAPRVELHVSSHASVGSGVPMIAEIPRSASPPT
ncbi:MAG: hypothetical protein M1546_18585, partial [Chloroflexi bacterium]|nr:hypothetical protein [Chloroflexota bacterium]